MSKFFFALLFSCQELNTSLLAWAGDKSYVPEYVFWQGIKLTTYFFTWMVPIAYKLIYIWFKIKKKISAILNTHKIIIYTNKISLKYITNKSNR